MSILEESVSPFRILGDAAYIDVNEQIYGLPVILKTSYSFTDRCYLLITAKENVLTIRIAPLTEQKPGALNFQEIAKEFCNQLLEQKMREQVLNETGSMRKTIVQRAFASGNIVLD